MRKVSYSVGTLEKCIFMGKSWFTLKGGGHRNELIYWLDSGRKSSSESLF